VAQYIYIAGPYTRDDPVLNTRKAVAVGDRLAAKGHYPYIPHLALFWHYMRPHPAEWWYEFDLGWLVRCDALLRLPGESYGADLEVKTAIAEGIPVFYSEAELDRWLVSLTVRLPREGKRREENRRELSEGTAPRGADELGHRELC
jgi:nucleoside 2-deoxyribosyltransferase